jgi:hypothetical protein
MSLKIRLLVYSWWQGSEKRGGGNEGIFHYVDENTDSY